MELVLNINNKNVTVNVPTDEMLLDTLRNLGYYSVRCGCGHYKLWPLHCMGG